MEKFHMRWLNVLNRDFSFRSLSFFSPRPFCDRIAVDCFLGLLVFAPGTVGGGVGGEDSGINRSSDVVMWELGSAARGLGRDGCLLSTPSPPPHTKSHLMRLAPHVALPCAPQLLNPPRNKV